jgi:metal-responsive CopG/Arc/MetJ family transcriptional regulator
MARTHVIVADDVLDEIDRLVGERGRSRFIEEAAREKLGRIALERALEASAGIVKGKRYEHWQDDRSTAAWVREGRRGGRRG